MMARLVLLVALAIFATCLTDGAPVTIEQKQRVKKIELQDAIDDPDSPMSKLSDGDLLAYDPIVGRNYQTLSRHNLVKGTLNLEQESEAGNARQPKDGQSVAAVMAHETGSPNSERITSIAHNSREVRLVGPNQKEVEMKDDMASTILVWFENLQKEAGEVWQQVNHELDKGWKDIKRSEVWGRVNEKLDKGWTEIKSSVESVVTPSRPQP